ncbi:MAG: acyl-CoA reductase, partial [Myxococcota bacterium]
TGIEALVLTSLGDVRRLNGPVDGGPEGFAVHAVPIALCGHVWASTIPTSGWIPVVGSLALGSAVIIKAPKQVLAAAEHLAASLAEFDPLMGQAVAVETWTGGGHTDAELVAHCDGIVVSGGRQAVDRYAALCLARRSRSIPCVVFGPGESVAVVPAEQGEPSEDVLDDLALDVVAYDQLGCLSPTALWVEQGHGEAWAEGLAHALDMSAVHMPRGEVPDDAAAAIMQRRGTAAFLGRVFDVRDAVVLWEPEPLEGESPRYRTVPVHTYTGGAVGLAEALYAQNPSRLLLSAAVAGNDQVRRSYASALLPLGIHRVCRPGTMQTPPATWHHDGMNWLSRLVRFVDLG